MDVTLSLDSVLILFVTFVFLVVSNSESKARKAIHELRMEHRENLSELRSENRELRSEMCQIHRELKSAERRIERLVSTRQSQWN